MPRPKYPEPPLTEDQVTPYPGGEPPAKVDDGLGLLKDRKDLRPYLMRRLPRTTHEYLSQLAYILRRGKEDVARECLLLGIKEMMRVNKIERLT